MRKVVIPGRHADLCCAEGVVWTLDHEGRVDRIAVDGLVDGAPDAKETLHPAVDASGVLGMAAGKGILLMATTEGLTRWREAWGPDAEAETVLRGKCLDVALVDGTTAVAMGDGGGWRSETCAAGTFEMFAERASSLGVAAGRPMAIARTGAVAIDGASRWRSADIDAAIAAGRDRRPDRLARLFAGTDAVYGWGPDGGVRLRLDPAGPGGRPFDWAPLPAGIGQAVDVWDAPDGPVVTAFGGVALLRDGRWIQLTDRDASAAKPLLDRSGRPIGCLIADEAETFAMLW